MKSFKGLKDGDKVKDKKDGMVMTYRVDGNGFEYLTYDFWAWQLWQFSPEDFERVEG